MASVQLKPSLSWANFIESAPHFDELLHAQYIEALQEPTSDPIARAIAHFALFDGELANGGVAQYFANLEDEPYFNEAPDVVSKHPLLGDVAGLLREAHERPDLGAAHWSNSPVQDEFNERAEPVIEAARMRLLLDILRSPHSYFDFEILPGVTGNGVEYAESLGRFGAWKLRFVDGFPIGPNFKDDEYGRVRIVRFSSSRAHIDYDQAFGAAKSDLARCWLDLTTGLQGERDFKDGTLSLISAQSSTSSNYRFSERFDTQGLSTNSNLVIHGVSLLIKNRHMAGAPFRVHRFHRHGLNFERYYFSNGQLNAERVDVDEQTSLYTASHDEKGRDLAPNGNGELKILFETSEAGQHWYTGQLIDGYLDGEVRLLRPDGTAVFTQRWSRGKLLENG